MPLAQVAQLQAAAAADAGAMRSQLANALAAADAAQCNAGAVAGARGDADRAAVALREAQAQLAQRDAQLSQMQVGCLRCHIVWAL
jgi:hypothetical protein